MAGGALASGARRMDGGRSLRLRASVRASQSASWHGMRAAYAVHASCDVRKPQAVSQETGPALVAETYHSGTVECMIPLPLSAIAALWHLALS